MDHHPLGFPGPLESSITPDQRISADVFRNFHQISPFFPNLMSNPMYDLPTKPQSVYFKTRMCVKFISGCCPKAGNCNFAHSIEELRRPPGNVDRRAFFPPEDRSSRNEQNPIISGDLFDQREEQKLHKKVCWKFYNGEFCPYGDKCSFSHLVPGSLPDSPLFNQKSLCWKTKICHKWSTSGNCSYGDQCSYAHGDADLRKLGGDSIELVGKNVVAAPPNYDPNLTCDNLSKAKEELGGEPREVRASQPKIRALSLRKISRIYGDWIDDNA